MFAAQEQALRTNWIRKNIDEQEVSKNVECVGKEMSQSLTECKKLAQKKYKQRHDKIARIVHLELFQKFGLVGKVKWYNHKPASVVGNDRVKLLQDFNIQTGHVIDHDIQDRRPDIVVLYETGKKCHLIDIAVPGDKEIELKEQENIDNYRKLRQEVIKIWNLSQVVVVPIVIRALGVTSKKLID